MHTHIHMHIQGGGANKWSFKSVTNWEYWWPGFPILVYFKENQVGRCLDMYLVTWRDVLTCISSPGEMSWHLAIGRLHVLNIRCMYVMMIPYLGLLQGEPGRQISCLNIECMWVLIVYLSLHQEEACMWVLIVYLSLHQEEAGMWVLIVYLSLHQEEAGIHIYFVSF